MLNIKNFYDHYGQQPAVGECLEIAEKLVMAGDDNLYITCTQHHADPFEWLSTPFDGVVFKTKSGYLATVAFFDGQEDKTQEAVKLCNSLIGLA